MNAIINSTADVPARASRYGLFIWLMAALAGLLFGLDIGVISGALPFIVKQFTLGDHVQEWIVSSMLVGAAIGAFGAGWLPWRMGRRYSLGLASGMKDGWRPDRSSELAMRALIVDDEALARSKLLRMLRAFHDVEVIGEASNGAAALTLAAQLRPDVIFLDVQMPEVDGFDVAASLPDEAPALVFVTAFDQYALRAFDAQAVDYLLKPVEPERLARTVQRLRYPARGSTRPSVGMPAHLMVADRGKTHIVHCADIEWLEAADNYVHLHLPGRSLLIRRTLAALLDDLAPAFVRTHRGAAVALAAVLEVRPRGKGDATVVLRSGIEVPCSRQHRETLMQRLGH